MASRVHLEDRLRSLGRFAVAVSGGVDSLTLAALAWSLRPAVDVSLYFADSAAVPGHARRRVHDVALARGWHVQVLDAGEVDDPAYQNNPVDRCYHCKSHLFDAVKQRTDVPVCTGANLDDTSDFRPGRIAARERDVCEPFVDAGYTKDDVRALARDLDLGDIAELPASPCLSSRVETGVAIDHALLQVIDAVEGAVRDLGSRVVRCRIRKSAAVIEHDGLVADDVVIAAATRLLHVHGLRLPVQASGYRQGSAFLRVLA